MLCPSFVCKLPHECEDVTRNAWRTPLNAQCYIKHRLQYYLFFTFLKNDRNRSFLYFLVNYQISIIPLLFWVPVSIPNPGRRFKLFQFLYSRVSAAMRYLVFLYDIFAPNMTVLTV